jgi:glutamyl-tRNA reductase
MPILLVGLNHGTAPIELREQLALSGADLPRALAELADHCSESVILSTCNRLEIYATVGDVDAAQGAIERLLARRCAAPPERLRRHLYRREERAVVNHLLRVAAGLDSLILGEPQILGQVARAYADGQNAGSVGPILGQLFTQAIRSGRRARHETAINRHTTSIGHAAVLLARQRVGDLGRARLLVVGAGDMAEQAALAAQLQGAREIVCINRTAARAEELARRVEGRVLRWDQLADGLAWADIVISATGAPNAVIGADDVRATLPLRSGRPLLFVDVAVPRDVDQGVDCLPDVHRADVDDLHAALDANFAQRQAAVPEVEAIIAEETERFLEWLYSRQVVPVIVDLRHRAQELAEGELELALRRLDELDQRGQQIVAQLARRIVNKLLHHPTARLKTLTASGHGPAYAEAIRELFDLDRPTTVAALGPLSRGSAQGRSRGRSQGRRTRR